MQLIEITKKEFDILDSRGDTYFANGCVFKDESDNLVAFPVYESGTSKPEKYYRVEK